MPSERCSKTLAGRRSTTRSSRCTDGDSVPCANAFSAFPDTHILFPGCAQSVLAPKSAHTHTLRICPSEYVFVTFTHTSYNRIEYGRGQAVQINLIKSLPTSGALAVGLVGGEQGGAKKGANTDTSRTSFSRGRRGLVFLRVCGCGFGREARYSHTNASDGRFYTVTGK